MSTRPPPGPEGVVRVAGSLRQIRPRWGRRNRGIEVVVAIAGIRMDGLVCYLISRSYGMELVAGVAFPMEVPSKCQLIRAPYP